MNHWDELWNDSDTVFAIALTLLVLDLRVPEPEQSATPSHALLALWPKLLSFLLSFFVTGLYRIPIRVSANGAMPRSRARSAAA